MLKITVGGEEYWDQVKEEFVTPKAYTITLEHSLLSIYKWEAKYHKSWLDSKKTVAELIDYIRCMTLTQNVPEEVYNLISVKTIKEIDKYMTDKMTATTVKDSSSQAKPGQFITAELIYYWMIELGIPMEWEKRHLNQLLTLVRVCSAKGTSRKMSQREILEQNRALNLARRAKFKNKGR